MANPRAANPSPQFFARQIYVAISDLTVRQQSIWKVKNIKEYDIHRPVFGVIKKMHTCEINSFCCEIRSEGGKTADDKFNKSQMNSPYFGQEFLFSSECMYLLDTISVISGNSKN